MFEIGKRGKVKRKCTIEWTSLNILTNERNGKIEEREMCEH